MGQIKLKNENLMKWLETAGMNQRQLASELDLDAGQLSKTMSGELEPSKTLIKKLIDRTGFPFDALFIYERA